jgi:hypothetical protein
MIAQLGRMSAARYFVIPLVISNNLINFVLFLKYAHHTKTLYRFSTQQTLEVRLTASPKNLYKLYSFTYLMHNSKNTHTKPSHQIRQTCSRLNNSQTNETVNSIAAEINFQIQHLISNCPINFNTPDSGMVFQPWFTHKNEAISLKKAPYANHPARPDQPTDEINR